MIHQLEIDDRDSQIPLIQVVQYSGDYLLVVGTVTDFGISGIVGWDADQPQQLLGLLRGQHVVQQCPLLQKIFRDLKATIVNPFLNADLKNGQIVFQNNLLCFCLKNTIKMSNVECRMYGIQTSNLNFIKPTLYHRATTNDRKERKIDQENTRSLLPRR